MCIELLPPGGYPTAVNKYIISVRPPTTKMMMTMMIRVVAALVMVMAMIMIMIIIIIIFINVLVQQMQRKLLKRKRWL
jgi:hypothetical protein